jgi:hypothetical protein
MKLRGFHSADVAEIQEAVTDELKKVQKEEFSTAFQKLYDRPKPVYMPMEPILNFKKVVLNLKTKVSPKTLGPLCLYFNNGGGLFVKCALGTKTVQRRATHLQMYTHAVSTHVRMRTEPASVLCSSILPLKLFCNMEASNR